MMRLAVFKEFEDAAVLERASSFISIDQAESPCSLAKSESEKAVIAKNAKLFFPPKTPDAEVEEMISKLTAVGFTIKARHPVTSAGCQMHDRVILTLNPTLPASTPGGIDPAQ
jgi:hypothetical protein